jgi:hypothetical protein
MIEIFHKKADLLVKELYPASWVVSSDTHFDIDFTLNVAQATLLRRNKG